MDEQHIKTVDWEIDDSISPTSQLRQGDLIAFHNSDRLQMFGLIVTADCDLMQRKHARLVTLVPVVELVDIVEYYLLPELCDRSRLQLQHYVSKTFNLKSGLDLPEDWEELRARAAEKGGDPDLAGACLTTKMLLQEVEHLTVSDYKLIMESAGLKVGKLDERITQQVQSKGDLLVLPQLTALGIRADIAWVRHVWQVPLRQIVFRNSEVREGVGQRVARLASPYRYRLTQLMAQVFSDIGLPDLPRNLSSEVGKALE